MYIIPCLFYEIAKVLSAHCFFMFCTEPAAQKKAAVTKTDLFADEEDEDDLFGSMASAQPSAPAKQAAAEPEKKSKAPEKKVLHLPWVAGLLHSVGESWHCCVGLWPSARVCVCDGGAVFCSNL